MSKRVLIVTPVFPMPEKGADQYERAGNIRQLKHLGFDVTVIAKVGAHVDLAGAQKSAEELGVRLITIPYRSRQAASKWERFRYHLGKLKNPLYLDGAAYEYTDPIIREALDRELAQGKFEFVWFDYTYLWPLYDIVRKRLIPVVTRSINFEPTHFLEEDGRSLLNYFKYIPKLLSELITIWKSDCIVALSPYEAQVYRRWGARRVFVVPLRGLPRVIRDQHVIRNATPLHVFFMGSTYSVGHNERAMDFVTGALATRVEEKCPGAFVFHISGAKVPKKYAARFDGVRIIHEGYIESEKFDAYLDSMDIAVSPSPKKVGMQQKVYEPLCRGIPLITSPVNTGGYPLKDGEHYLAANTEDEYVKTLLKLHDPSLRSILSKNSIVASRTLFSQEASDRALKDCLNKYLGVLT